MPKVGIIGYGAMAGYVAQQLQSSDWTLSHCIARKGREEVARARLGQDVAILNTVDDFAELPDLVVDCAGHDGLRTHGGAILQQGVPLITVSLGALADDDTRRQLTRAATIGGTQLHLASGAIGALDALAAAKVGGLEEVRYTGVKRPEGWLGSPAETAVDLTTLTAPFTHFEGTARGAALHYPKNANVAAAVALAGIGFDRTETVLVADPDVAGNTHRITARGAFGTLEFEITGNSLPDAPRTSALAAMSVVERIFRQSAPLAI